MTELPRDDRRQLLQAPIRLDFDWLGDRWTHSIQHLDLPGSIVRAESIDPPSDRPECLISPAYQEITQDEDGSLLMLIGRAGGHHVSAVVTRTDGGFGFDVANRCSLADPRSAATYLLDGTSSDLEDARDDRIVWRLGPGRLILTAESGSRLALAEAGRRYTRVQILALSQPDQRTQRLAYRWEWAS